MQYILILYSVRRYTLRATQYCTTQKPLMNGNNKCIVISAYLVTLPVSGNHDVNQFNHTSIWANWKKNMIFMKNYVLSKITQVTILPFIAIFPHRSQGRSSKVSTLSKYISTKWRELEETFDGWRWMRSQLKKVIGPQERWVSETIALMW